MVSNHISNWVVLERTGARTNASLTSKKRFQGGAWGLRPAISGHSLSNGQEHGQIGQNHENRHLQVAVRGRWCLKVRGPTPKLLLIDLKTCSNTDFIARGKLEWYRFVELKRPKRNTYCGPGPSIFGFVTLFRRIIQPDSTRVDSIRPYYVKVDVLCFSTSP